jgi:hypothetical protein
MFGGFVLFVTCGLGFVGFIVIGTALDDFYTWRQNRRMRRREGERLLAEWDRYRVSGAALASLREGWLEYPRVPVTWKAALQMGSPPPEEEWVREPWTAGAETVSRWDIYRDPEVLPVEVQVEPSPDLGQRKITVR